MPSISACPNCCQQVSIPPGAPRGARVRCPLCQAEFPLRVIVEAALPELVLIEGGSDAPPCAVPAELPAAEDVAARAVAALAVSTANGPVDYTEDVLGSAPAGELPALAEAAAQMAEALARFDAGDQHDDQAIAVNEAGVDGAAADGPAESDDDYLPNVDDPLSGDEPDFGLPSAARIDAGSVAVATGPPRKQHQPNMVLELVKVVLGGFVGLCIAYGILLLLRRDPLDLAPHLPRWLVPRALESSE